MAPFADRTRGDPLGPARGAPGAGTQTPRAATFRQRRRESASQPAPQLRRSRAAFRLTHFLPSAPERSMPTEVRFRIFKDPVSSWTHFTAAFQDILKWRRCSCDAPGFIELFCGAPRLLGLPIRG